MQQEHVTSVILLSKIQPESNHEEKPDKPKSGDSQQNRMPVLFKNVSTIKTEEMMRNLSNCRDMRSKHKAQPWAVPDQNTNCYVHETIGNT